MSKNLSHRQRYLNELDEAGIKVTFHPDLLEPKIIIRVQKGYSYAESSMTMEYYYDDLAYDYVLRELVRKVENEWSANNA